MQEVTSRTSCWLVSLLLSYFCHDSGALGSHYQGRSLSHRFPTHSSRSHYNDYYCGSTYVFYKAAILWTVEHCQIPRLLICCCKLSKYARCQQLGSDHFRRLSRGRIALVSHLVDFVSFSSIYARFPPQRARGKVALPYFSIFLVFFSRANSGIATCQSCFCFYRQRWDPFWVDWKTIKYLVIWVCAATSQPRELFASTSCCRAQLFLLLA